MANELNDLAVRGLGMAGPGINSYTDQVAQENAQTPINYTSLADKKASLLQHKGLKKQQAFNPTEEFNDSLLDPNNLQSLLQYSNGGVSSDGLTLASQQVQAATQQLQASGITDPDQINISLVSMGLKLPKTQLDAIAYQKAQAEGKGLWADPRTNNVLEMQRLQREAFNTPNNQKGNTGFLRQLGSGALNLGYETLDTVAGMTGTVLNKTGLISDETDNTISDFLNPVAEMSFADEVTGYDRNPSNRDMANIANAVKNDEYMSAIGQSFVYAPTAIVDSAMYMAALFVGGGKVKLVKQAGESAFKLATRQGATLAERKVAQKLAEKQALKAGTVFTKVSQLARDNTGLLAVAANEAKSDAEAFEKNYNRPMNAGEMSANYAVKVLTLGLDKWTFKSIAIPKNAEAIKALMKELPKSQKEIVAKGVYQLAVNAGKEGTQEYTQQWGSIISQYLNTDKTLDENIANTFNEKNNDEALTAAAVGVGSGGTMGAPAVVLNARAASNSLGQEKVYNENLKNTTKTGFKDQKTKDSMLEAVEGDMAKYDTALGNIEAVNASINDIKTNPEYKDLSDIDKVEAIKASMNNLYKSAGNIPDSKVSQYTMKFGDRAIKSAKSIIQKSEGYKALTKEDQEATDKYLEVDSISTFMNRVGNVTQELNIPALHKNLVKTLNKDATQIMNSTASNVTYEGETEAILAKKEKLSDVKKNIKEAKSPITELDTSYEELSGLKGKELEAKLASYDNKTLSKIAKIANKEYNKAVKENRMKDALEGMTFMETLNIFKTPKNEKTASTIGKVVEDTFKGRKASQDWYDPKKPIMDRIKSWMSEAKTLFYDKLNELNDIGQDTMKGSKSNSNGPTSNSKEADNKVVEKAKTTIQRLLHRSTSVEVRKMTDLKDLAIVQEALDQAFEAAAITEVKYNQYKKRLDERIAELDKKTGTSEKVKEAKETVDKKVKETVAKSEAATEVVEGVKEAVPSVVSFLKDLTEKSKKKFDTISIKDVLSKADNITAEAVRDMKDFIRDKRKGFDVESVENTDNIPPEILEALQEDCK